MKTIIYGFVKVKENNAPLPGVIVSLSGEKVSKRIKAESDSKKPNVIFKKEEKDEKGGLSFGSVITDKFGKFQLELDMHNFPYSKESTSYQLYLRVYAPLGSGTDSNTIPKLNNCLLEEVELPTKNLGEKEALVILIKNSKLEKFSISPAGKEQSGKDISIDESVAKYVKNFKDQREFQQKLRQELLPFRNAAFEKKKHISNKATEFVRGLSAIPKSIRDSSSTFASSKAVVKEKMRMIMREDLGKMASDKTNKPGFLYAPTGDTGNEWMPVPNPPVQYTGIATTIDGTKVCEILNAKRGSSTLTRVRELLDATRDEGNRPAEDNGSFHEESSDPNGLLPEDIVSHKIVNQILSIGENGKETIDWTYLDEEEISNKVQKFQIGAGPADHPAFHDFHNLQIAFRHIWTEAFDPKVKENLKRVYERVVDLHEDYIGDYDGTSTPFELPEELVEIEQLQIIYEKISSLSQSISENFPSRIIHYFPDADATAWIKLSQEQQLEILNIISVLDGKSLNGMLEVDIFGIKIHIPIINGEGSSEITTESGLQPVEVSFDGVDSGAFLPEDNERLIGRIQNIFENPKGNLHRVSRLLKDTVDLLTEPYSFQYFAPNSANYGILATYRQRWVPLQYQVGDLISTIPLAPGEKRKFTTKQNIKRTRAEKELDKALRSRTRETNSTQRADEEITSKATWQTNFQMTARGSFRFGLGEISGSTQFTSQNSGESASIKKGFREAVVKAAQEYKDERSLEVNTTDEFTSEITSSGELSNPNNEITVTYLLYELERLYNISERIHRVTPVILVAQDIPAPNEITESWLISHEWILRRVLLDDNLLFALDYLTDSFSGEEVSIAVHKANWEKQHELVTKLEATVERHLRVRDAFRRLLVGKEEERALSEEQGLIGDLLRAIDEFPGFKEIVGDDVMEDPDILEIKRKTIESKLNYLQETLDAAQSKLSAASESLQEATRAYTHSMERQINRRVAIDQLRVHVKQNVFYYMQAIWDHEPPDQRYFRLYDIDVEIPESRERHCTLRKATITEIDSGYPVIEIDGENYVILYCDPPTLPEEGEENIKKLVEIADLDHPLGYKGNYMIFPLKACTHLTDFMMQDFFDDYFGVKDPDETANYSADELVKYAEIMMGRNLLTEEQEEVLNKMVMDKLSNPRRDSDIVVIPTGNLFMEALTGSQPLLEEFKLKHRKMDVEKVRAEVRQQELENLRRAARMLKDEPNLEDPDVDKHIVVKGDANVTVETE